MSLSREWLQRARSIVGGDLLIMDEEVEPYSHDEFATDEFRRRPEAVARPHSEEEVARLVAFCAESGVPVTARGAGTGLSGSCLPSPGGIVLSLERLNRVIDADRANHTITVQAGMTLGQLYGEAGAMGLFFPPHPGDEGAFIGGAVATNAGGARAVKYGTIRRFVLGLQVVLADGQLVEFGGKLIKSSMGYNLLNLMIGSEGTLGVITRVTLALLPPAGSVETLIVPFPEVGQAVQAVPAILDRGIIPTAVEFIPHRVMRCAERLLQRSWPAKGGSASLLIILDGFRQEEVIAQAEALSEVLESGGALDVLLAESKARQAEILEMRSMLYEALRPGTAELFDICVPCSQIVGHVQFVRELEERLGIQLPTYGHAADGNVHTHHLRQSLDDGVLGGEIPNWRETREAVRQALYEDAIGRGGVISGEHGIGEVKRAYLERNLGSATLAIMRSVKRAMDPKGILNPGKIFDD
jgi:glycolate oxidase